MCLVDKCNYKRLLPTFIVLSGSSRNQEKRKNTLFVVLAFVRGPPINWSFAISGIYWPVVFCENNWSVAVQGTIVLYRLLSL